jgi:hypothetical protein
MNCKFDRAFVEVDKRQRTTCGFAKAVKTHPQAITD